MDPGRVQILFADLPPEIVARRHTNPPEARAASAVLAKRAAMLDLPLRLSIVPEGADSAVARPDAMLYPPVDGVDDAHSLW